MILSISKEKDFFFSINSGIDRATFQGNHSPGGPHHEMDHALVSILADQLLLTTGLSVITSHVCTLFVPLFSFNRFHFHTR